MKIIGGLNRIVSLSLLGLLLSLTTASFAGTGGSKSPYHKDHNPLSFYYFGYNTINPGFTLGTHINLSWTKMEKAGCEKSVVGLVIPTVCYDSYNRHVSKRSKYLKRLWCFRV